jgi:hypothetical protein
MLCYLARQFPPFVENFLERGRTLRRRFREETITDLMMGSLITAGTGRVIVEFPDEPVTGADMEWNFVNPGDGTFFRILLQAKQAYGDGTKWTRHGYRELLHTSGTGTKLQAETLCDTARIPGSATYPLYIFYHPAQTCALARKAGMIHVAGVNLADGYVIERLVKAAKTRAFRTSNKSLRVIAPHLFPMSDLFCPPTLLRAGPFALAPGMFPMPVYTAREAGRPVFGVPIPPTPQNVRNRLAERRGTDIEATGGTQIDGLPEVPAVAESIPDDVQAILRRSRETVEGAPSEPLRRWRITFVSVSPREADGG